VNNDGIVAALSGGIGNFVDAAAYDPLDHSWHTTTWNWTIANVPIMTNAAGVVTSLAYSSVNAATYDPSDHNWHQTTWTRTNLNSVTNKDGIVASLSNGYIDAAAYDPYDHAWHNTSWVGSSLNTLKNINRIVASASANSVDVAVYDPNTHTWSQTAVSGSNFTNLTIAGSTASWQSSTGNNTRGYSTNGWGAVGSPILAFSMTNFTFTDNYPLIHVRNMSVGAQNVSFDFGDGTTVPTQYQYHLYKVGGHYLRTPHIMYNICLIADNGSTCQDADIQYTNTNTNIDSYNITIFPNPVMNTLQIQNNGNIEISDIKIINLLGQTVSEAVFNNTIDVSSLPNGTYFLYLNAKDGGKYTALKFLKI
jgi:Secretion system C-terminal sorting domain